METIDQLIAAVQAEAERGAFPIDAPVYRKAGKDPSRPILFAGSLAAPVCFVGRDLGKDEVALGEPLIGAAGRLVRSGVYARAHGTPPPASDRTLDSVLDRVLLTNTVPYKPPGNKAYAAAVKERFRPFLAELLAAHWRGNHVITLGTEAFQWFAPYVAPETFTAFWHHDDRYEAALPCAVTATPASRAAAAPLRKPLVLMPLPHPSPLNQRWYKQFPALLARRLEAVAGAGA